MTLSKKLTKKTILTFAQQKKLHLKNLFYITKKQQKRY